MVVTRSFMLTHVMWVDTPPHTHTHTGETGGINEALTKTVTSSFLRYNPTCIWRETDFFLLPDGWVYRSQLAAQISKSGVCLGPILR